MIFGKLIPYSSFKKVQQVSFQISTRKVISIEIVLQPSDGGTTTSGVVEITNQAKFHFYSPYFMLKSLRAAENGYVSELEKTTDSRLKTVNLGSCLK